MRQNRLEQIQTELRCRLCGGAVEVSVRERGYYGHTEHIEDVPEGAFVTQYRKLKNGKGRYNYRLPGYVPHCSNDECFLRSANKMYRNVEDAKAAWIEKVDLMGW